MIYYDMGMDQYLLIPPKSKIGNVITITILALSHPRLGYLHLTEPCQVLVLYDAAAQPTVDFKTLRQSMAAAVRQALEKNGNNAAAKGWRWGVGGKYHLVN